MRRERNPLLTIVIFVWVGNTVADYVLEPLETSVRWMLVKSRGAMAAAFDMRSL